jgi:predicted component of type VI protein secretion system
VIFDREEFKRDAPLADAKLMKKVTVLCALLALCAGQLSGDTTKDEKKAPPGLQKKGGVPPGQAKKKTEAEEATPATAPAAPAAPVVVNARTPAPASAPAASAAPAPTTAKPATPGQQRATLEANRLAINKATESNPAKHKAALQQIVKQTGVTLEHLKEQDKKFPAASATGLLLGNVVAKKAGVKFSDVIQAREKGKQWDEIARTHNVDVNILVQESSELVQTLRGN